MLVGGLAIDRLGHSKVLVASLSAIALANLSLAWFFSERGAITYLALYEMLVVFTFTTFFAATMSQCGRAIAATQFSVTMVCGNLTMSLGAALMGPIVSVGGSAAMLLVIAAVAVGGAIVMVGWQAEAA
jgi:predicted MFS family arabinose efflux permease